MGSSSSRSQRAPSRSENDVIMTSYVSMFATCQPPLRNLLGYTSRPLPELEFGRIAALCPLPRKVFTPFPDIPHAVGHIVKVFPVMPPAQCYRRCSQKYTNDRLCYRVECHFLPRDESHLIVCSGRYFLRPGQDVVRVNNLYDGLTTQWMFGSPGEVDHCCVIKGSRSSGASNFAISQKGRFFAWPAESKLVIFDRYAGTTCQRHFYMGDCVKAVAFSPTMQHLAVVSCLTRRIYLRITVHFADPNQRFRIDSETDLTSLDPSFTMTPTYDLLFNVAWSPSGRSVIVSSSDGHFIVLSKTFVNVFPHLMLPHNYPQSWNRARFSEMRLSGHKAFDLASVKDDENRERVAIGLANGEIVVFSINRFQIEEEIISIHLIPPSEATGPQARRINCLRFANAENWLAVFLSSGEVLLLDNATLDPLAELQPEPAVFQAPVAPEVAHMHGFSSASFSFSDSYLAAGASDGRVRIWCLKRMTGPLQALCRRAIRTLCTEEELHKLSLPMVMLDYLRALTLGFQHN